MAETKENVLGAGPLSGLKVVELSTVVAGPLAAGLLADLGAEVIKIELPGKGDPLRALRPHKDGISLWSKVLNRNKRMISLDLRTDEGREILLRLVADADVLMENFRPGTLEQWQLGPDILWQANPVLTILRISGFGQEGPYANRPGFARIADAMSGFLSLCGDPDRAPTHPGYPVSDTITGLFGAFGVLAALLELQRNDGGRGQVVSVSLLESMIRILDFLVVEHDQLGEVRQRSGNRNPFAAPGNVYRTRDGRWCSLAASTQTLFERLARAIDRADLIDDPRFADNRARLANYDDLDGLIAAWFLARDADDACAILHRHDVTVAPVYDIRDVMSDPHVLAAGLIQEIADPDLGPMRMQAVTPKFSATPGRINWAGRGIGADNERVFGDELALEDERIADLKARGIV